MPANVEALFSGSRDGDVGGRATGGGDDTKMIDAGSGNDRSDDGACDAGGCGNDDDKSTVDVADDDYIPGYAAHDTFVFSRD